MLQVIQLNKYVKKISDLSTPIKQQLYQLKYELETHLCLRIKRVQIEKIKINWWLQDIKSNWGWKVSVR